MPNVDYGPGEIARRCEILRTVVGSTVHGLALPDMDDTDEMGIFVEPPEHVLGLAGTLKAHVWRTQPEGVRSGPGDTDRVVYPLRRYLDLVTSGNPTVLVPLFAPPSAVLVTSTLGEELRAMAPLFVSQRAGRAFLGYLDNQRQRLLGGGKQNRVPNRPEIIEKHGFDVKYASHALRLGLQGIELMTTGRLSLPMPMTDRRLCLDVKEGKVSQAKALGYIEDTEQSLRDLLDVSTVPAEPDRKTISTWAVRAHLRHWQLY